MALSFKKIREISEIKSKMEDLNYNILSKRDMFTSLDPIQGNVSAIRSDYLGDLLNYQE